MHKYPPTRRCRQLWWDQARGEHATTCDRCDSPLVASKGQPVGEVPVVGRTSAALDSDGVARDGMLFHDRALRTGQTLHGWVHGPATAALRHNGQPVGDVLLGSRRSVRGAAALHLHPDDRPDPVETHDDQVVLRLASPGVFVDAYGLPTDTPDTDELADQLAVDDVRVTRSWTRWTEVGGWHAASGLPKPTDRAVAAGSTYLLDCTPHPTTTALTTLATRGIGLRRREGCGALYHRPPAPPGFAVLAEAIAPLRVSQNLIRRLRERAAPLRAGAVDDTQLTTLLASGKMPDPIARGVRTMLATTDPTAYDTLLDFLDER
ncbi:hypothetical protein GCM10023148_12210 [Actinokineospora soli]